MYTQSLAHCNTLQHTATHCNNQGRILKVRHSCASNSPPDSDEVHILQHAATHCNTLQHTATHCSTLQHTATHCNTLQHTATHCNTLQHATTHCNTLQHTATHCPILSICGVLMSCYGTCHVDVVVWHVTCRVRGLAHVMSTSRYIMICYVDVVIWHVSCRVRGSAHVLSMSRYGTWHVHVTIRHDMLY